MEVERDEVRGDKGIDCMDGGWRRVIWSEAYEVFEVYEVYAESCGRAVDGRM